MPALRELSLTVNDEEEEKIVLSLPHLRMLNDIVLDDPHPDEGDGQASPIPQPPLPAPTLTPQPLSSFTQPHAPVEEAVNPSEDLEGAQPAPASSNRSSTSTKASFMRKGTRENPLPQVSLTKVTSHPPATHLPYSNILSHVARHRTQRDLEGIARLFQSIKLAVLEASPAEQRYRGGDGFERYKSVEC